MSAGVPSRVLWPVVIAGALVVHVVASLITVWVATSDPSYAVEDDYYRKAVAWDERRAQERHNAELGWRLDVDVTPAPSSGTEPTLSVRLSDPAGGPLDGASISLEAFHNARADEILRADLAPRGDGEYASGVAMRRPGVWELRFTVDRGGEHFTHTEMRYLTLGR